MILKIQDTFGQGVSFDIVDPDNNFYLSINDVEYGAVFVHQDENGTVTMTLRQYDQEQEKWIERNSIQSPA